MILVFLRLCALLVSPLELGPDEAQYWRWAKTPDWGYFSKPPLIAWAIALTTKFFGDAEWAVRLSAPIAHAIAAYCVARAARTLAGRPAGAAAALLYLSAPGVGLSSFLISTDAFLLACAAAALAAALVLRARASLRASLVLGAALGLGLLAKYAMVYAVLGIAAAAFFDRDLRRHLMNWRAALGAALMIALIAPNLYWNGTHSFATFNHTASNANWGDIRFDPRELGEFIAAQFGVFGPLAFALLPFALWPQFRKNSGSADSLNFPARPLLALLIAPPLLAVSMEALISRANANWAAIAYPAGAALIAAWCMRNNRPRLLFSATLINALLSFALIAGTAAPDLAEKAGAANSIKRARGWDDITRSIAQIAAEGPMQPDQRYMAVVFDNRLVFHEADYYGRKRLMPPLRMWLRHGAPQSQAEATAPLAPGSGPFLVVISSPTRLAVVRDDFARFEPRGHSTAFLGGGKTRRVDFYEAEGYAPKLRDAAFDRRWGQGAADKDN